jgi:hypothetical protein
MKQCFLEALMLEVTVNHLGSVQFEVKARQHAIVVISRPRTVATMKA